MAAPWRQNSNFYQKYLFHVMTYYNNHPDVKIYMELLLTLFTIIFLSIFAIKPTATTVASLSAELEQKLEVARTLDSKIEGLNNAAKALDDNKSNIEILNEALPNSPMVEDYVKQLEAMAIKNGVQINDLEIDKTALIGAPVVQKDPANSESTEESNQTNFPADAAAIPVKITVTGAYAGIKGYLQDIESHRRPISIVSVSSSSAIDGEDQGIVRLSISGKVPYFYIPKEVNE